MLKKIFKLIIAKLIKHETRLKNVEINLSDIKIKLDVIESQLNDLQNEINQLKNQIKPKEKESLFIKILNFFRKRKEK